MQQNSDVDVVVVGASLSGLVAAWEMARTGLSVLVLEAEDEVREDADALASAVRDPGGSLTEFLADLELTESVIRSEPPLIAISGEKGTPLLAHYGGILGIPESPLDRAVSSLVGVGSSFRGYLDRIRPVLTVGKEQFLGPLVRGRMGSGIADRLVEPVVWDRFGVSGDSVEVAAAIPGLNEAVTRTGSLSGAVLALSDDAAARETLHSVVGGFSLLYSALLDKIRFFGGQIVLGQRVSSVAEGSRSVNRAWTVGSFQGENIAASSVLIACDPDGIAIDMVDGVRAGRISADLARLRADRDALAPQRYSIIVIRCDSSSMGDAPNYTIAASPSSRIRRIERIERLWPHVVAEPRQGTELIRVVYGPGASEDGSNQPPYDSEIADFLGVASIGEVETCAELNETCSFDIHRVSRDESGKESALPSPTETLCYLGRWPVDGPLGHVIEGIRTQTTAVRRTVLGLV